MIDIIIPAYNCEKMLENTVDSVIKSGLRDFKVTVINDGSADSTETVCEKLSEKYDNFDFISKENGGVSSARNFGVEKTSGEYILFFDADDTVDEGAFLGIEDLLSRHNPDLLGFGMIFEFYKNGKCYRSEPVVYDKEGLFEKDELLRDFSALYNANWISAVWNKFIKRNIITDNKIGFDKNMIILEDLMFSLKVLDKCKTVYCLKEPIYRYRQSEKEDNAYKRLSKIPDIAEYLLPLKNKLKSMSAEYGDQLIAKVYFMLLYQKIYCGDIAAVKTQNEQFLKSDYSDEAIRPLLSENDKKLFDRMKKRDAKSIYFENKKTQLRHKVVVFVKSIIK